MIKSMFPGQKANPAKRFRQCFALKGHCHGARSDCSWTAAWSQGDPCGEGSRGGGHCPVSLAAVSLHLSCFTLSPLFWRGAVYQEFIKSGSCLQGAGTFSGSYLPAIAGEHILHIHRQGKARGGQSWLRALGLGSAGTLQFHGNCFCGGLLITDLLTLSAVRMLEMCSWWNR